MKFMKRKALQGLSAILLLLPFGIANAADSGFYIGGSIGQATLELPADPNFNFDENDTSWKLLAGYNFDLGTFDIGVEAGYVNLGKPAIGDSTASVQFETVGFNAFGLAGIELGPVDLYAKAGFIYWDVEARIGGSGVPTPFQFSDTETGTDFGYGIGASWNVGKLGIRAEYEGYDIADTDTVYMLSLGLVYRF
jgi:opacity protein-like surface antigen